MSNQKLLVASNNKGKLKEIQELLAGVTIITPQDINFNEAIDEPFDTFQENAAIKAKTLAQLVDCSVIADDSGLCVTALDGAPGVHSAYYGGEHGNAQKNIAKLLDAMEGVADRSAYFISVICLVTPQGDVHYFEGKCHGTIATAAEGGAGFGYDPIFIPEGYDRSFAALGIDEKNKISHRAKALAALQQYFLK